MRLITLNARRVCKQVTIIHQCKICHNLEEDLALKQFHLYRIKYTNYNFFVFCWTRERQRERERLMKKQNPPNRGKRRGREMHALEGVLCVFILSIFTLSILILALSVARAYHDDNGATDDDDVTELYENHSKRRSVPLESEAGYRLPTEVKTLETLEEALGESAAAQSGWLPRSHRFKRNADGDIFSQQARREADTTAAAIHSLDLRSHKKISDDTFYLGTHPHPRDSSIELHTYAFVHKASKETQEKGLLANIEHSAKHKHFNRTKPLHHHKRKREVIECGAPIAEGARWKITRGYYSHPINKGGMHTDHVVLATESAVDTWRCVFREMHIEPFGPLLGVILDRDEKDAIDFSRPTGDNHIAFGRLTLPDGGEDSTLAVTITHGRYGGTHNSRYIAEFSTIFNDGYKFSDCASVDNTCRQDGAIDYQSIATHELGHAGGLDDLYSSQCTEQTMYWSAKPGETNKRTLTEDDINSMKALYQIE